jgi:hypothetical protein
MAQTTLTQRLACAMAPCGPMAHRHLRLHGEHRMANYIRNPKSAEWGKERMKWQTLFQIDICT